MHFIKSLVRIWLTRSFRPFLFTNQNDSVLSYDDTSKLGLYIHIPFCRSLCSFCPYCKVTYDRQLAVRYTNALLREIDLIGQMNDGQMKTVTSLYFGGGTPALLSDSIKSIISRINDYFVITEGIGIELHPQDVSADMLQLLRDAGITKISIGVQSFDKCHAGFLGREPVNPLHLSEAIQSVPFATVSMDFIFALPGQTKQQIINDIETAFASGANQVALYPLIDFSFTQTNKPGREMKIKKQLLFDIVDYCNQSGYNRETLWTFSKKGSTAYSSMTRENFLGFGCSATTLLPEQFKINTFDPSAYIDCLENYLLPTALTLRFVKRQRMVYYLFWTAYTMQIDPDAFRRFFGKPFPGSYQFTFFLARLLGFLTEKDSVYNLTTKGSYYYHLFEYDYTLAYIDQMWSTMRTTAFPHRLVIK